MIFFLEQRHRFFGYAQCLLTDVKFFSEQSPRMPFFFNKRTRSGFWEGLLMH